MTASAAPAGLRRALARATAGKSLDVDEVATLIRAEGAELDRLVELAGAVRDAGLRDAGRPGVVTYSRKVFIPLTRLCRDRCHYCTFATAPAKVPAAFLSPDEVLEIARRGAALQCKEALFTLGDRPEDRWRPAREWLDAHGYASTLDYVRAMAIRVLEETGLLPHLNPGVMSWQDLQRLKPVAPSMGLMLETTSRRLFEDPAGPHHGSPDKDPDVRLRVIDDAGRSTVPFTTGVLVGIGETPYERAESLLALRSAARAYGHVQEVIVQNFRAKPDTAMRDTPDVAFDEYLATVATARLVLGPTARVQAPPNLSEPASLARLLAAGVDDWGGVSPVTPDHVNPERPWPDLEILTRLTADAGFTLRERLTVHPEYIRRGGSWLDPRIRGHVEALADPDTGLAVEGRTPVGRPWQEPDPQWGSSGRIDLHDTIDSTGRSADRRGDFDEVYGDWETVRRRADHTSTAVSPTVVPRLDADLRAALDRAASAPASLLDPAHERHALALLHADGPALDSFAAIADDLRKDVVGDTVTYVVNRNINFTNVCYVGCRFCAFAQRRSDADAYSLSLAEVTDRAQEAWNVGATEVCLQGGIDPDLPGTAYADLVRALKQQLPDLHVHAFSPMELVNAAARRGRSVRDVVAELVEAGLDSIPGTAAEILDDEVRWVLTKGKLPAAAWVEVVAAAHEAGLPSSATMMFGHVDQPHHWLTHLRVIASVQDRTGGFTEFVPLPFVHHNAPLYLAGVARPGPTPRENRAVHAAARVFLAGRIDHVQVSWVKLGPEGVATMLAGGADDLGGTLMEETISRMAGSSFGSALTVEQLHGLAAAAGRPAAQRTTTYATAPADRQEIAARTGGVLPTRAAAKPAFVTLRDISSTA
jgi:FO synthase